jgi:hypothetical protein
MIEYFLDALLSTRKQNGVELEVILQTLSSLCHQITTLDEKQAKKRKETV